MEKSERELKCFEYQCELYTKCARAAGSCCAIDDFFEDITIQAEQCYLIPQKPYFIEK